MMHPLKILIRLIALCLAACTPAPGAFAAQSSDSKTALPSFRYRWVYIAKNLQVRENVSATIALLKRAKAAGYNGVLLADYKLGILDRVPAAYFDNAREVKKAADDLGLAFYPAVAPFGYSDNLLAHDPNLAEGIPVRDAAFVVHGDTADVATAGRDLLTNGGFEPTNARGDSVSGWDMQDAPGSGTFVDRAVMHGGASSLRFEEIGRANAPSGNGRVARKIDVIPFHQYHLSVWIKTDSFARSRDIQTTILPTEGNGPSVCYNTWSIARTQDWKEYHAVFNSLNNHSLRVYLGVWGGTTGKLWLDDAKVEEVGLLNVLRRDGCPLMVRDPVSGTTYEEGRDFAPVRDERMGTVPYAGSYEVWHAPPVLHILPGSRIHDGQILSVSFSHCVSVYENQVAACLLHPKVEEIAHDQINRAASLLHPPGMMLGYDEIRVANWDGTDQATGLTPGQQLARSVAKTSAWVQGLAPGTEVFVWSDMFDPSHNAHGDYYLVNGSWAGSWEGLPKGTVIVNWNSGKPKESLPFFAGRGYRQILAGYYDGRPESIRKWLDAAKGVPGIDGVMYTTWANKYDDLEAFARAAWGEGH